MERITLHIDQIVINPDINPRHASDDDVSDLVAQIRANGFSDAIWVRPLSDGFKARAMALPQAIGCEQLGKSVYEVIDGSRRIRALRHLIQSGELIGNLVDCDLIEADDARARELALAANVTRKALTPADEARAFCSLKLGGMTDEQIASHFAVPVARVRQRVAIGHLPDPIIEALRSGKISIETAQAFTLTSSREHQLKIFGDGKNLSRWDVKQAITKKTVSAHDVRATFVGLDAYRDAGGKVIEDLFSEDAFLDNEKLLQKLFDEKLKATVKGLKDAGWAFVKVLTENTRQQKHDHQEVKPKGRRQHTPEEISEIAALEKRQAEIADRCMDIDAQTEDHESVDSDLDREYDQLEDESLKITERLAEITEKPFTQKQIEALGVLIIVPGNGRHGQVEILRGRMPAGEEKKAEAKAKLKKRDIEAETPDHDDEPLPAREAGFSEAVEIELVKAARQATKLAMLRAKPAIAARLGLAARVQNWLMDLGTDYDAPPFAQISNHRATLAGGDIYAQHMSETVKLFVNPKEDRSFADILAKLETMTPEQITAIEAAIAAHWFTIDALRNVDVQTVIKAIDPDMRGEGFRIDADFLGRLSRDQIAIITVEINPDAPVAKGKKPEMVAAALPIIEAAGWLPEQLRTPSYKGPGSEAWKPPAAASKTATQAQDKAA